MIHLYLGTRLRAIEGNGHVDSIRVQARQGQEERVPVAGIFLYLQGAQPVTDYLQGQLETTSAGCLRVDDERQTSIPGVFAVGDLLCSHVKQAVLAAADGVTAAMAVDKYMHGYAQIRPDWK
jgi:thioredoxin reductase (NADPH)